jgi:four helix bundle protein
VRNNPLKDKSYEFAIRIVKLSQYLQRGKKEFVLSKQVLRSGTAVGALIREAEFGQSRADFTSKMSISLKEANETEYWLSLLDKPNAGSVGRYSPRLCVLPNILVNQAADHALIGNLVFFGLLLKKLHTLFAECQGHFHRLFPWNELRRGR